jgi:hypothetical protein
MTKHYYIHLPSGSMCSFSTKQNREHYHYCGEHYSEADAHTTIQLFIKSVLDANNQLMQKMYNARYNNHYPYLMELVNTNAALEFQFRESITN